jgi:tripartite ATP-independent transporter DctM subunit
MIPILSIGVIVAIFSGLPIAFALCVPSILVLVIRGIPLSAFIQNFSLGVNSFPLLAVPFFILAGNLMNSGGITQRIFRFANALVGPIPGGLGQVNIIASLIFAGMSGAAVADAAGLGVVEIKAMRDAGYDRDFSAAITAASSTIGPIIPPSIIMVVYGVTAEVSVGRLFMGGVIPGFLMTAALMLFVLVIAIRKNYPREKRIPFGLMMKEFLEALPALFTPLIIVGGILGGVFTPTEAGAIACLYAFIVGLFFYRELNFKDLYRIALNTMMMTALILFIVGAAKVFGWVLTYLRIPAVFAQTIGSLTQSPLLIILLLVGVYIFLGCFMEASSIVVMTVPVVLPLLKTLGIDPVYFGVLVAMCMSVGTLTPPVGTVLYVVCNIAEIPVEHFIRTLLPYIGILLLVIVLVAIFPQLVLFLPNLLFG